MSKLSRAEKAWVHKVNVLLAECPSARIGFYTTGDATVFLFDVNRHKEISKTMDTSHSDWGQCVEEVGAGFGEILTFPNPVESTAG